MRLKEAEERLKRRDQARDELARAIARLLRAGLGDQSAPEFREAGAAARAALVRAQNELKFFFRYFRSGASRIRGRS